jgi:chromosome segregation protein
MVHVKRVELSHFKSFGGTTAVPFLDGFTVVSGPNGSGKSNILDALLFCLGLASSKGMRAERLPDLVNNNYSGHKSTAEASVSVTFDLSDLPDLKDFCKQRIALPADSTAIATALELEAFNAQETSELANENGNGSDPVQLAQKTLENGHSNGHTNGKVTPTLVQDTEWTVSRRLRVTKGGSYSSNYYINGEPCSVSDLHEQLNRLRIYPEGYNVVLQGDVTRIITMNSRERRVIIDEMAGVAEFDRKIEKTKETLEEVREGEERYQIIETELKRNLERLAEDRIKAERYQKLKQKIQEKQQWEAVFVWRSLQQQASQLQAQIVNGENEAQRLTQVLSDLQQQVNQTGDRLEDLNRQVKALGEDEQLATASELATLKAQRQQLLQRQIDLQAQAEQQQKAVTQARQDIEQHRLALAQLNRDRADLEGDTLPFLVKQREQAQETLGMVREQSNIIAEASDAWVQEQTNLSRKITSLQEQLNPLRTEFAQLTERQQQLQKVLDDRSPRLTAIAIELDEQITAQETLAQQVQAAEEQVWTLAQQLTEAEQDRSILQETQDRLSKEQREKQRQLDKLEATHHAQQEAQGTYATQLILNSNLAGVYGLVAQLGQVQPRFQLALEIAAGGRLAQLVVEDDRVAAAGIELLKQARAGRATFLPLNKIQAARLDSLSLFKNAPGFVDFAVNLVLCKEAKFQPIFAYVFGNTAVFEAIEDARAFLGRQRMVTLDGDLLEVSGAMTGGSQPKRSGIRFGKENSGESTELREIKHRLQDLEQLLARNDQLLLQKSQQISQLSQKLNESRQQHREQQLQLQQLEKEILRLQSQQQEWSGQHSQNQQELAQVQPRLLDIAQQTPALEAELGQEQARLKELEQSQTHSEWQQIQALIKTQEAEFQERDQTLRQAEEQLRSLAAQAQRLTEKTEEAQQRITAADQQSHTRSEHQATIQQEITRLDQDIQAIETRLAQLSARLGETKQERDRLEAELKARQQAHQQSSWQLEKLQTTQQERQGAIANLHSQITSQEAELPNPLPEIPALIEAEAKGDAIDFVAQLEELQKDLRQSQKRLEAMEPVNMLALEEHAKTQERLDELSDKLATLEGERTELLLRIENFTTLRFRSFKDAFDAVNVNFQGIFATLSDGDGYLQLENPEDPFAGGLNLVAHPKGKPVQRLSSMSGGEKSLTALSFIFALQRYRPSPFYAFDEVDMFLDGANVERLSKMIQQQAKEAQFIVVSLRRPMIEASERTIGVTQARGAHTQVIGIKL